MSKIIVTGGAGYIGSHTIIELVEKTNFEIISIDNYSNSSADTYDRISQITGKKIKHYAVDLCDLVATEKVFQAEKDIVGIIHFAAFKSVPESVANPHKYYYNNINSLLNIVEMSLKYEIRNFIFSSSCSVYGEIDSLPVSENSPLNKAICPYAFTKQIGEQILADYAKVNPQFQTIALRYFNPVGAHPSALIGESPINPPTSLVPVITQTAIGKIKKMYVHGSDYKTRDGSCIRDYVHVCDIAEAHTLALNFLIEQTNTTNFDIINLGTGSGVSVFEAIKSFEKVSGEKLNYEVGPKRTGDVAAIFSETSKSKKVLSWEAKFDLDKMMQTAWEWEKNIKTNI